MGFHPIMSLGLRELQPIEIVCMSPCLNPLTTSKMKILITDVNSDLTAIAVRKHEIWN
jgi:hypothetical protein